MLQRLKTGKRYYFTRLPEPEKQIYRQIYQGLAARQTDFRFPLPRYNGGYPSTDRLLELLLHVIWDNPALFWFDATNAFHSRVDRFGGMDYRVQYTEYFPGAKYDQVMQVLLMRVEALLEQATRYRTEYEQVRYLYEYLVKNVRYMHSVERVNALKNVEARTVVGPLLSHLGVCAGYTKAFKLLCDQLGIPCLYVRGQALTTKGWGNHGWNAVWLNGRYYHVDVTMDSETYAKTGKLTYDSFLRRDVHMSQNHRWDNTLLPPMPSDWTPRTFLPLR